MPPQKRNHGARRVLDRSSPGVRWSIAGGMAARHLAGVAGQDLPVPTEVRPVQSRATYGLGDRPCCVVLCHLKVQSGQAGSILPVAEAGRQTGHIRRDRSANQGRGGDQQQEEKWQLEISVR